MNQFPSEGLLTCFPHWLGHFLLGTYDIYPAEPTYSNGELALIHIALIFIESC